MGIGSLADDLAETRFRQLYAEHGRDLLAYALRRVPDPDDAADVVAETFLVAWRRAAFSPTSDAASGGGPASPRNYDWS
jgi:DNA-directed RNA polymerase specialized sigma24 family protein